jgi:hypothetical protein
MAAMHATNRDIVIKRQIIFEIFLISVPLSNLSEFFVKMHLVLVGINAVNLESCPLRLVAKLFIRPDFNN